MKRRISDWEIYLRSAPQAHSTGGPTVPPVAPDTPRGPVTPHAAPGGEGIIEKIVDFGKGIVDEIGHFFFGHIDHLPVRAIYPNMPAVPVSLAATVDTLGRLLIRTFQTKQALQSLTNRYKIGGIEGYGRDFLYDQKIRTRHVTNLTDLQRVLSPSSPVDFVGAFVDVAQTQAEKVVDSVTGESLMQLSLETPDQWTIGWTTFPEVYQGATRAELQELYAKALVDADEASRQFWPMIAENGLPYNLLILEKVDASRLDDVRQTFCSVWSDALAQACDGNLLYMIDLRLFERVTPRDVHGNTRFTPGAVVLLTRDSATKSLTPFAIRISGYEGTGAQVYCRSHGTTDSAWIYALLAAKTSITVWGVWLGHVYHWHIVTAAMQMTMFNNLKEGDPVYEILGPQSKFLIGFDDVILLLWGTIAPPTSIASAAEFLALINHFSKGRTFFDDDPVNTLRRNGIDVADFTEKTPWDRYPIAGRMLEVWNVSHTYIDAVVKQLYPSDASVASDRRLQAWLADSGPKGAGNIRGLPENFETRDQVISVLTSLLYRITIHGSSRLNSTPNPALTFLPNYPPCLQVAEILSPKDTIDTKTLMSYLPKTGTIGEMITFYFTFAFSVPYEPLIPLEGIDDEDALFYADAKCNAALVKFREDILGILHALDPDMPQIFQWPMNIET